MSMTRKGAIKVLRKLPVDLIELTNEQKWDLMEALDLALAALRPVSREQVEQARWIKIYENGEPAIEQHQTGVACSKCMEMPEDKFTESRFCPNCGRPMTDEAVDMVMERLEALREN